MTTPNKMNRQTAAQTKMGPLGFHWRSVARVLWEGKFAALAIWSTLTLVTVGVVRNLPSAFKADCLILVIGQKIPENYVSSTVTTAPQERLAAISHLILSNERLQRIIEEFNLYRSKRGVVPEEEIIKQMREKDIEMTPEAGLADSRPDAIRISYQASNPKIAAEVTNRLASLIITENSRSRKTRAANTSEFIEDQLGEARRTLDRLEAQVKQYKLAHNGELPEQESSLNGSLSRLQATMQGNQDALSRAEQAKLLAENDLSQAESSLTTLQQTELEAKEAAKRKAAAAAAAGATAPSDTPKPRIEVLQEELATLRLRYGNRHPEIRRREDELAELQLHKKDDIDGGAKAGHGNAASLAARDAEAAAVPAGLETAILAQKERVADLRVQRDLAIKAIAKADAERQRIGKEIEADQSRIDQLPLREQEMAALTRDYEIAKQNYKSLLDKKLSAEMASNMESSQEGEEYTLIEPARVPERPFKPKRGMLYIGGSALSLAFGLCVVLGFRLPKDKVLGEWELGPGVVVLGRVPQIKIPKGGLALPDSRRAT